MTKRRNAVLWTIQTVLALLFLVAGGMKLVMPLEAMQMPVALPGALLRFIGVCEVLGAAGLILPALLQIQPWLTPVAAGGLMIIMVGAIVFTVIGGGGLTALFPFIVLLLLGVVARGRARSGPVPATSSREDGRIRQKTTA
jgi:DoxX-like protein